MIVKEATLWLGYLEHITETNLEFFDVNIGKGGCTIFADIIRRAYPWRNFMNLPWCTTFVHAVAIRAVGVTKARMLLGKPHPGSRVLARRMKRRGCLRGLEYTPCPGDLIFCHNGEGRISHCGIVECVMDDEVISIEGNTADPTGHFPKNAGGVVARRRRKLTDNSIVNYGRISDAFLTS